MPRTSLKVAISICSMIAATVITGTAIASVAQNKPADKMSEGKTENASKEQQVPPPSMDTNKDGKPDAWDRDGNGVADAWDVNGDGQPDQVDNNGDGKPDDASTPPPSSSPKPSEPGPSEPRQ